MLAVHVSDRQVSGTDLRVAEVVAGRGELANDHAVGVDRDHPQPVQADQQVAAVAVVSIGTAAGRRLRRWVVVLAIR